ncbi:YcxB family protein [Streptomyces sp. NPDC049555]|uniref:YcxB family protein n=1 Tax=Streptomyces sp. NPDC049555 TaxID=3154930 RepID=UPI003422DB7C
MSETLAAPPAAGSVTLEFELTLADVRSALAARMRAVPGVRRQRILLPLVYAVLAVAILAPHGPGGVEGRDWITLAFMGFAVAVILLLPTLQARAVHKTLGLQGRTHATADAEGLTTVASLTSQRMLWPAFGRYTERDDVFVLLSPDKRSNCVVVLPKRGLPTPDDTDRLRALLDSRLPRV